MRLSRSCLMLFLLLVSVLATAAGLQVVYPADEVDSDARHKDLVEILTLALTKTVAQYGPFELHASAFKMNEARYLEELKSGQVINVAWSSTSAEKERDYLPLLIPLRKGILGYRVMLIRKSEQALIDKIHTVDDLKKLTIGQGIGWGDVGLYRSNGFTVVEANYDGLFKMTANGHVDAFPRGVSEIFPEFDHYAKGNPDLAVERHVLIYYPWPFYLFFNKRDILLHDRIEAGVRTMIKDGSFDVVFKKYNGDVIKRVNLLGRRIIRIRNDGLPADTPLNDDSLWFDPARGY